MKKINVLLRCTCPLLFAMLLSHVLHAQISDSLYSRVLQQNRCIEILLPPGGLKERAKYDVFYVLDGEWNITLVREITDFLVNEGMIPPQIIVGVLNGEPNMRDRDFTPTQVADNPLSGKADNFIRFLKNELLPYIDGRYPVSGRNMLYGHSLGGLFGMYALLKEPGLFNSNILGDPSFWWDNHFIYPLTVSNLQQPGRQAAALFILGRKGNGTEQLDAEGMDSVLRSTRANSLYWKIVSSPEETHGSTKLRTLVEGLRFIYKGYIGSPILVNPTSGGFVLADRPFLLYCYDNYIEPFKYEIDGIQPVEHSKPLLYTNQFTLDHSTDLTIMSLTTWPVLAQKIKEHFEVGPVFKSEAKPQGTWLPNKSFNLEQLKTDAGGWKKLSAYLEIKETGYYDLQVAGASAIRWWLGKKLVMTSDSSGVNGHFQSVIVPLERGFYSVHIEVRAQHQEKDAVLLYNTPASGGNGLALLPDLLYLQTIKK